MNLRRLVSSVLLLVFLFNIIGYYGVYLGLRSKVNGELKQKLDEGNFSESETFTIAIPFNLPYQSDWGGFRRVDGDFELDGKFFNVIKQKVERDTLFIVCIPDHHETTLFESLTNFVHASTDTPASKNAGKVIEHFSKDFLTTVSEIHSISHGWVRDEGYSFITFNTIDQVDIVSNPPPEV